MENPSAHAGFDELIEWIQAAARAPTRAHVPYGEPETSDALRIRMKGEPGTNGPVCRP